MTTDARVASRSALLVTAALLEPGERVESVAQGVLVGAAGVLALTDRRLLAVNQEDWTPTVVSCPVDASLVVQAWEDAASATVQLTSAGQTISFETITDRPPAYDLVARIRARTGQA
jgi:hypothetical protein